MKSICQRIRCIEIQGAINIAIKSLIHLKRFARKKGFGTALMNKFLEIAKKRKATRLELEVHAANKTAMRFYQNIGFRPALLTLHKDVFSEKSD